MQSGPGFSSYAASKFAVVNMSEGLATELKPLGIGVIANAHDWACFGEFLRLGREWNGQQLLPTDFVDYMRSPVPASDEVKAPFWSWTALLGSLPSDLTFLSIRSCWPGISVR